MPFPICQNFQIAIAAVVELTEWLPEATSNTEIQPDIKINYFNLAS